MTATNFPNGITGPILPASGTQASAIVAITDNSGGTGTDTIAAIGATYDQAEVRDAVASLADKIEEIRAALEGAQIIGS